MCNEVRRLVALGEIADAFSHLRLPLSFPEGLPNLAPLKSVRITDPTAIVRTGTDGAELVMRRWSWPAPGGKPVYNFRSEGRSFANSATGGRCLIPVDGFYEFTTPAVPPGAPKPKRKHKWLFEMSGAPLFCLAGLWRAAGAEIGEAFALLTTDPGPDIAPYHSRQVIPLHPDQWGAWLDPAVPAAGLLQPLPAGSLTVRQVA